MLLWMALGILGAAAGVPAQQSTPPAASTSAPKQEAPQLDARARRLANMLQLSEAQQLELAKVLASRREQVHRLWSEQTVAAEYRVSQMRAIEDQTEERIRGLLTDEQRKKYLASRPAGPRPSTGQNNLEHWLNGATPSK